MDITNILERWFRLASSIYSVYNKLTEYENNGLKDCEDYKKYLNYLQTSLDIEEQMYLSLNLKNKNFKEIYSHLLKNYFQDGFKMNIRDYIYDYQENIIMKRILMIIYTKEIIRDEFSEFIFDDILKMFVLFLEEFINKENDEVVKKGLIKIKNDITFMTPSVERVRLVNDFEMPNQIFFNSTLGINDENEKEFNIFKGFYAIREINENIVQILNSKKSDKLINIIRMCIIRAMFLLLKKETLEELNINFDNYIYSDEYYRTHKNNEANENLIKLCFEKINEDKEKVCMLVLKND